MPRRRSPAARASRGLTRHGLGFVDVAIAAAPGCRGRDEAGGDGEVEGGVQTDENGTVIRRGKKRRPVSLAACADGR